MKVCSHCFHRRCCAVVLSFAKRGLLYIGKARYKVNKWIVALYIVTFLIIMPILCFDMKNSLYFLRYNEEGAKQSLMRENSRRLHEAQQYFYTLDKLKFLENMKYLQNGDRVDVALTIITVSRNRHKIDEYEPNYLTQVIWKFHSMLHRVLSEGFPHRVTMRICNVDHDPGTYEEAKNASRFVPVFQRFDKTHFSMVHPLEKEKQDYIFCLNRSLETNPRYVLLVEDDALPTSDFFSVLDYTLRMHMTRRFMRGELILQSENIAYVKFYHPDWLLSFWSLAEERIPELIALTSLLSTILLCFYVSFSGTSKSTVGIYFCFFVYSFLLVAVIGRPNFTTLRSILSPYLHTFSPAPSCCTPAMLFPSESAKEVVSYLDKITCDSNFGKDSGLDRLLIEKGMKAYLVQPNTFTHIGLYSSLRDRIVDPFIV